MEKTTRFQFKCNRAYSECNSPCKFQLKFYHSTIIFLSKQISTALLDYKAVTIYMYNCHTIELLDFRTITFSLSLSLSLSLSRILKQNIL